MRQSPAFMRALFRAPQSGKEQYWQEALDRFADKITESANGCWEWTGHIDRDGYGLFTALGRMKAHRFSFLAFCGVIEPGYLVCHHCDNRRCCNPAHLYAGTNRDNIDDMLARGRHNNQHKGITHCKRGHEFTPENTRVGVWGKRVTRSCRACIRERYAINRQNPEKVEQTRAYRREWVAKRKAG